MSDLHFSNLAAKKNPAETGRLIHPLALLAPGAASAGAGLAHKAWVPVASAEHVRLGREQGFMQVCHGKAAPLRRVHPGDRVVYYSPSVSFRGKDKLQCFTALGVVQAGEPFAFDMGGGFCPFRRELAWSQACETPILPLLDQLEFTEGVRNWGYQLRFGLLAIGQRDIELIASAMQSAATN